MRRSAMMMAVMLLMSCLALCVPVSAEEGSSAVFPETPEAAAVYFYHMESGRTMGARNEKQQLPAGSTGKVIAGLIACERLAGQLADEFQITSEMMKDASGYRYRMGDGDVFTGEQLLYLAVCGSYNDAFDALAYLIGGGDKQEFVKLMNQRAQELGAVNTHYTDPSGIADSSFTTAEDQFYIARAAAENPLYMSICGSIAYDLPGKRINNRNALLSTVSDSRYYNAKCRGMSAGITQAGKCCLVTLAQSGNDRYLCVVLGAEEGEGDNGEVYSYVVANRLIKWGYENFTYLEVVSPKKAVCSIPVRMTDLAQEIEVKPAEAASYYLPAGATVGKDVFYSIRLMYEELEAPVAEGMLVGYLAVVYEGEILGTVPLHTAGSAERGSFVSQLMKIQSLTESRRVRAGGIFFLVAVVGWLVTEYVLKRRRRRKWDKYFSSKIDLPETILQHRK